MTHSATTQSAALTESPHVAHHFDDAAQQAEAMTLGMWLFLVTELMFFGGVFAAYTMYRIRFPGAFIVGSQELDVVLGALNTGVLLVSSFTVVLGIHAAQTNQRRIVVWMLLATILLGVTFLGVKGVEYSHKFTEHHVPGPQFEFHNENSSVDPRHVQIFFSLYFAMTGVHALHMLIGIAVFAMFLVSALRGSGPRPLPLELAGLYWHFVDIVWVFLFPMLYLVK